MDLYAFPPIAALLDGAHDLLIGLSRALEPLAGSSAAAAAVVLVTLLVRAALIPVGISQAKAERTRARLAPKLAELRRRHGDDRDRLRRETMALYAEEGASPFAGCLPVLIQAPVVGVIYALFILPEIAGHPNGLLDQALAGVPLGSSLAGSLVAGAVTPPALLVFGIVILGIAMVGEVTRRAFRARPLEGTVPAPATPASRTTPGSAHAGTDASALLGSTGFQRTLGLLQFATAVIAVFLPLAAALYLLVTVAWTLGQRMVLRRAYPSSPAAAPV